MRALQCITATNAQHAIELLASVYDVLDRIRMKCGPLKGKTMSSFSISMLSPQPAYLDQNFDASRFAPRPASLDGKIVGLLPNWRPSAVHILRAIGHLLQERYRLKEIVMEQPVRELPLRSGKLLDSMQDQLDSLARRVDVVVTASGD